MSVLMLLIHCTVFVVIRAFDLNIGFIFLGIGTVWLPGKCDLVWVESEIWVMELK